MDLDADLEMRKRIRGEWRKCPVFANETVSPGEAYRHLLDYALPQAPEIPWRLRLWLILFDEFIAWFASLQHVCVMNIARVGDKNSQRFQILRALFALSSRIISDLYSIRMLVSTGFSSSARALGRSTIEHIEVASLLLSWPDTVPLFLETTDNVASTRFWNAHIRGQKARRKITAYLSKYLSDKSYSEIVGSNPVGNMATHPSLAMCFVSALPPEVTKDDREDLLYGVGVPSELSIGLLNDIMSVILEFCFVLYKSEFDPKTKSLSLFVKASSDYFYQVILEGRHILLSAMATVHRDDLTKVFFPDDAEDSSGTK